MASIEQEQPNFVHFYSLPLRQGQVIEWDEEVKDSLILPASVQDSSAELRALYAGVQNRKFHVIVSVPDSTIPHFRIQRTITQAPSWDTLAEYTQRLYRSVTYGTLLTEYDRDLNVTRTVTMSSGADPEDFADMPFFEYRPDSVVSSTERTAFMDTLATTGTVTDLGTEGIRVISTFTDENQNWEVRGWYDRDYLTLTKSAVYQQNTLVNEAVYTYSSIGGYKINTSRTTQMYNSLPASSRPRYTNDNSGRNYSDYFDNHTAEVFTISNLQLP